MTDVDLSFTEATENLLKQGKKADAEDKELAEILGALIKHPGWPTFAAALTRRIQGCSDLLLKPVAGLDGTYYVEWLKGCMSGMILARDLPQLIVEQMAEVAMPQGQGQTYEDEEDEDHAE